MTSASDPASEFFSRLPKEVLFQTFLNQVEFSVFFKDTSHRYMLCSSSFARLLGYKTPEEIVSRSLSDFVMEEEAKSRTEEEDRIMETRQPLVNQERHLVLTGSRSTAGSIWLSLSTYPLIGQDGEILGVWGIARDISEEKNTAQKLMQKNRQYDELSSKMHLMATVDEVTGLYNRKSFEEMIRRNMRVFARVRGRGYTAGFCVILMDIDHFTKFCSTYGIENRDIALQYMADILRSCSRSADDIFRVGNDEFALILPDTAIDGAHTLSNRISHTLIRKPLLMEGKEIYLTLSYGYAVYDDQLDASELIIAADQSLFDAKKSR